MGKTFRTTVFGGFNKKDVVSYLGKNANEKDAIIAVHEKETAELERKYAEANERALAAIETAASLRAALAAQKRENSRLLEHHKRLLSDSERAVELDDKLTQAQQECVRLRNALEESQTPKVIEPDNRLLEGLTQRIEQLLSTLEEAQALRGTAPAKTVTAVPKQKQNPDPVGEILAKIRKNGAKK